MFEINEDKTINITRGDIGAFTVDALNEAGEKYLFQKGDVVRIKVTEKKACENVMFQKDFVVEEETEQVEILLTEEDTKIGEVISKPTDYWYEIELNPFTNPQTIIGYDEDGAKIFKLYPEGKDVEPVEPTPEDIPVVDEELDLTSERPVQNHVIARAILNLQEEITKIDTDVNITSEDLEPLAVGIEENKSNIAKNKGNIEDLSSNVENLTNTLDTHTANTSNPHNVTAEQVSIDNSTSGLSANQMQGAIDELKGTIGYSKKQLIPYPHYNTTLTMNGVTWTDNGDGTITANGTATADSFYFCRNREGNPLTMQKGNYILNGCANGGSNETYYIYMINASTLNQIATDKGEGYKLQLDGVTNVGITCIVKSGTTVNNLVFKPMLRYASIEDDTYEPYVPSVDGDFGVWTAVASQSPAERNYYVKTKNTLTIWFTFVANRNIDGTNWEYNFCTDVKKTFGINSFKDAFGVAYASNGAIMKIFASAANNVIACQKTTTDVSTAYAIYGQIALCIDQ